MSALLASIKTKLKERFISFWKKNLNSEVGMDKLRTCKLFQSNYDKITFISLYNVLCHVCICLPLTLIGYSCAVNKIIFYSILFYSITLWREQVTSRRRPCQPWIFCCITVYSKSKKIIFK